jgi:hypothetical protein
MKNTPILVIVLLLIACACEQKTDESNVLTEYLSMYDRNADEYKVVCIVPADGCMSCIDPSLQYAKTGHKKHLLVLTSMFKKSLTYTSERLQIGHLDHIQDAKNKAIGMGLVSAISPCYYFLENGKIIKKVDLDKSIDKSIILAEVDRYLMEDRNH